MLFLFSARYFSYPNIWARRDPAQMQAQRINNNETIETQRLTELLNQEKGKTTLLTLQLDTKDEKDWAYASNGWQRQKAIPYIKITAPGFINRSRSEKCSYASETK